MLRSVRLTISLLVLGSGAIPLLNAAGPTDADFARTLSQTATIEKFTTEDEDGDLGRRFSQTVGPFITAYCAGCHSGPMTAASFDLQRYPTLYSVDEEFRHWEFVIAKLSE